MDGNLGCSLQDVQETIASHDILKVYPSGVSGEQILTVLVKVQGLGFGFHEPNVSFVIEPTE
jgi:hypothetical protein